MREDENLNIVDRKNRFNDFILYLKSVKTIRSNQDIVNTGIIAKSSLSKAVNGNEKYLTKDLITRLVDFYPTDKYTLEYVWDGNIDCLTSDKGHSKSDTLSTQKKDRSFEEQPIEQKLNEIYLQINNNSTALFARQTIQDRDIKILKGKIEKQEKILQDQNNELKEMKKILLQISHTNTNS